MILRQDILQFNYKNFYFGFYIWNAIIYNIKITYIMPWGWVFRGFCKEYYQEKLFSTKIVIISILCALIKLEYQFYWKSYNNNPTKPQNCPLIVSTFYPTSMVPWWTSSIWPYDFSERPIKFATFKEKWSIERNLSNKKEPTIGK